MLLRNLNKVTILRKPNDLITTYPYYGAVCILGLGLSNSTKVTTLGKPYYLLYIPVLVTKFKFLKSNPVSGPAKGHLSFSLGTIQVLRHVGEDLGFRVKVGLYKV